MRTLHLTLKKRWFDLIASGVKTQEYREIKPYWEKRLIGSDYDLVSFRNGYSKTSPTVTVRLLSITKGIGLPMWGAPAGEKVFILWLGEIILLTGGDNFGI